MNKSRLWVLLAVLAALFIPLAVIGCGDDDDDGGGEGGGGQDLGTIKSGQLLVGTDTPFEPFEIGQPPNISGYDIEVMDAIAAEVGLEVSYQDTGFDTLFRDVAQGVFDAGAAASTITPDRQKVVNFTDPYYEAQQALLVAEDSEIGSVADLEGATVATQDGTTGETYANEETGAGEVRGLPEGPDAISALVTGQVDAVIIDQPVAQDAVKKSGDARLQIAEVIQTNEFYGFPVSKKNTALLEAMNAALATLKENGTLAKLYKKYFGIAPPASVLEGATESG